MRNNGQHQNPADPDNKEEENVAENERAAHLAFGKQQQYIDSDDAGMSENDDPNEVDSEGGDSADKSSVDLDDDEA